jgi:hypothetical protein
LNALAAWFSCSELSYNLNHMPAALRFCRGDDAARFLQARFPMPCKSMASGLCLGLWLDRKGRIVADSHILGLRRRSSPFSHTSPARRSSTSSGLHRR